MAYMKVKESTSHRKVGLSPLTGRGGSEYGFGGMPEIVRSDFSFTRPSDTTAYTAKDVVGNTGTAAVITLEDIARVEGGVGEIVAALLATDQSTNTATYRLHIFNVAPTAIADNAAFTLLEADIGAYQGYIDFAAMVTEASGSEVAHSLNTTVRLPFVCADGSRDLYAVLTNVATFTPASAQQFYGHILAKSN